MNGAKTKLSPLMVSVMTFVLALGILCGVLVSKRVGFDISGKSLDTSRAEIFKNGFLSSFITFFFAALGAVHIFLTPLIFVSLFSRGLSYGFTAGTLVRIYNLAGFFRAALGIGIYNFLAAAVFVPYAAYAFTKAAECRLNRANYAFVHRANKVFLLISVSVLALLALLALAECFIGASKMIL